MKLCGVHAADTLQITSWDNDHCASNELERLLVLAHPRKIEVPGYEPTTDSGRTSNSIIREYRKERDSMRTPVTVRMINPAYISGLQQSSELAFRNIFYHPRWIDDECCNNNSTVTLFRTGIFNVLSLGDVESPQISSLLRRQRLLCSETDIMILAHHGADNRFTNKRLLEAIRPQVVICSSNYDNQYDHPRQEIRDMLWEQRIDLFTTKTGDVVVQSTKDPDGRHSGPYQVLNLKADSDEISSINDYQSKKARLLTFNADTLGNAMHADHIIRFGDQTRLAIDMCPGI
jgi:competence protein ComEC